MTEQNYEAQVRKLIAFDNIDIPLCALHKRVDRRHKKLAESLEEPVDAGEDFGCTEVNVDFRNKQRARAIKEAVSEFCKKYPAPGRQLKKMIAVNRTMRETYLQYGLPEGRRISSQDYIAAMTDVGLTQTQAEAFYPRVLEVSRTLQRARGKETTTSGLREVLIGKSEI